MASVLKKTEVELESVTDAKMLLLVKKTSGVEYGYAVQRYAKAKSKYMKYYNPNTELVYLMDGQCLKNCL